MEMVMVYRPRNIVSLVSLAFGCREIRHNKLNLNQGKPRDIRDIRDTRDRYRSKVQYPLKNITKFKPRDTRDIRDTRDNRNKGISLKIN